MSLNNTLNKRSLGRWMYVQLIVRVVAVVLGMVAVVLMVFVLMTPITISGALYMLGFVAIAAGTWGIGWERRRLRRLVWVGTSLMVVVAGARLLLFNNSSRIKMFTLPDQNAPCLINCLFDEQDVALFSTRFLSIIGWTSPTEQDGLLEAMVAGYRPMAAVQPIIPSPFARTYLNQQHSGASDTVVIEPDDQQPAQMGVIFLHGFTGNFTLPCWLIAQAVTTQRGVTVCPSVGWRGDWWTANGESTLRATIDYLHQRGIDTIFLAGLSNGAVGAGELAHKLTEEIAGLILISGASPNARDSNLPVLILAGSSDERMPAEMMREYAARMGDEATFVEFPGDHFMLAKNSNEIQNQIISWLQQQ